MMFVLTLILAAMAGAAIFVSVAELGLVVYLWHKRRTALRALQVLNNGYESLLMERAYLLSKEPQKPLLWCDKGTGKIH